jgi:hypothetical protein
MRPGLNIGQFSPKFKGCGTYSASSVFSQPPELIHISTCRVYSEYGSGERMDRKAGLVQKSSPTEFFGRCPVPPLARDSR